MKPLFPLSGTVYLNEVRAAADEKLAVIQARKAVQS
jgi:hypothetical protein